ncbi:unnamed protein product [Chironomus riparius]|uniref:CHK kinase-like domain-containing protein n=1 Tax=Chironomus riparius TaxID=315576 RepID=A0A9N9RS85_9DIPT|nr:unnamed protein product [Chironomus riparius]
MAANQTKLPSEIYEKALAEVVEKQLNNSIDNYDITISAGSSKGDNYLGVIYRAQVKDKVTNENKLNLIVKLPPQNEVSRKEMFAGEFFKREAGFYDNVYPIYEQFQKDKGIDVENEGFHQVANCYKTLTEEPNEGLIFDDLKARGFDMFDRFKEVTKEHVFLVMRTLGKFHAVFYAIKDQKPEVLNYYYTLKDSFKIMSETENSTLPAYYSSLKKQTIKVVEKCEDLEVKEKVMKYLENDYSELIEHCLSREKSEPYTAICHGDCWNNNMLFMNNEDGSPKDLRFLDFQIIRYATPVTDLVYYIFGCTTKSLRDKHYHEFFDVYHAELSSYMRRLGSDPEVMYPRKALDDQLKTFGQFGLLMAMMVLPIFTSIPEDIPNLDEIAESFSNLGTENETGASAFNFTSEKTYDNFSKRLLDVCHDMCSLGYI